MFDHFIAVYEFNQDENFRVTQLHFFKANIPHVTAVKYNEDAGLIVGSFRGFVEVFDPIDF